MTTLMPRAEQQQAAGIGLLVALLTALSVTVGLGPVGWLAGVGYALGLCALLTGALRRAAATTLGPADLVTLARAGLVGGVTALVADGFAGGAAPAPALVGITVVALALDAVDGRVARRTGTTSALGARFDMEVDAFLVLVLSGHVAQLVGPWALAIGAMRYLFVGASLVTPWMRAPLPTSYLAKTVAVVQGVVLVVAAADVLARPLATGLVATALVLLAWSFGRSVGWLWQHRTAAAPQRSRRIGGWVLTLVAGALVLGALVVPGDVRGLTPAAFVCIPLEALVGVALLLVLPARTRPFAAVVGGVALGLLTVLKIVDMGFSVVLGRPFDPLADWTVLGSGVEFLAGSIGRAGATGSALAAVLLVAAVLTATALAVRRLSHLVTRHRGGAARATAALAVVWVTCAVLGAQLVPGVPIAAAGAAAFVRDEAVQVQAGLQDHEVFAAEVADDAYRNTPADQLLTALRGKDVVLAYVESYGRSALDDPELAAQVGPVLDDGGSRLAAAGFGARSAFLTSPTAGGGSWLAHSTLLSGLWIDGQQRYHDLSTTDRLTLTRAFGRAGWRTVGIMPGVTSPWPEAAFYGYHHVYDAQHLGYNGPRFSFATMPDQYALAAFERLERAAPDRPPVMAEIPLMSSHAPWSPLPELIDWNDVGDGSVFQSMAAPGDMPEAILTRDPVRVRADYARSIAYSLTTLVSYVTTYGDDDLVLVLLGDHQPAPVVTGEGASRDVPITVVARDPAVLDRIAGWNWEDGLEPGPQAPVWPMNAFRDQFLSAFGSSPESRAQG